MQAGERAASEGGRAAVVLGVLVGGRGRRMGGVDKGMLRAPGEAEGLAARLVRLGRGLDGAREVVVVGDAPGYGARLGGVRQLADAPAGVGPMGGLRALLAHAGQDDAILLACDLPYVSAELLRRLSTTAFEPGAAVLAPREPASGKWQPLFARYRAGACLAPLDAALGAGTRSFQTWFRGLRVQQLPLSAAEHAELRDWDEPADLGR